MTDDPHFYSWSDGFSTDKQWDLTAGVYRVTCNDLPQPDVLCCMTGPNGFVKKLVRTSDGAIRVTGENVVTEIVTGYVEVFRP